MAGERGGGAGGALAFVGAGRDVLDKNSPRLEDEVTVEVVGQPGSTKKQLYYLALSAANSLVRQFGTLTFKGLVVAPPFAMLMIEYDAADDWVRCTLRYSTSSLAAVIKAAAPATSIFEDLFTGGGISAFLEGARAGAAARGDVVERRAFFNTPLYQGPACSVVGAEFGFTSPTLTGLPVSSKSDSAPKLEFAGKTILTACPQVANPDPKVAGPGGGLIDSPNPKPPGDNRSRGAVVTSPVNPVTGSFSTVQEPGKCCPEVMTLIPLVYAALTDPGSLDEECFEAPTAGPVGR